LGGLELHLALWAIEAWGGGRGGEGEGEKLKKIAIYYIHQ